MAVQVLGGLGADPAQLGEQVIQAIESQPEGLEYSPPLRVRPARPADPVERLLTAIEARLSVIERHLGIESTEPGDSAAG